MKAVMIVYNHGITEEIEEAFAHALNSPEPQMGDLSTHVYA